MRPLAPPIQGGEKIRLLHVVRPAAGGIRQHVLELVRRVDPARFATSLAGPPDFLAGLPGDLPVQGRLLLDIAPRLAPGRDLLAAARLAQYVGRYVDLVHAHGLRAAFVAALARRLHPFPLLFTAHNLVTGGHLARLGLRLIGSQASQVIAISHAVADGLTAGGLAPASITVIPNGVDVKRFRPSASPIRGETQRKFMVGCVARLSPEKGVDVLLRAAALLPDADFVIAGDGPERAALDKLAPPNVRFLGRVTDTREIYRAVDVIAVPSRQEGQGIVALEAMASGVAVVASRVGGLAEMLTDGETASLVPPNDPAALAEALAWLRVPSTRKRYASTALALVREHYDVRQRVEAVQSVYAGL